MTDTTSKTEQNNFIKHAFQEFRAAGWVDKDNKFSDPMQERLCNHVLALLQVFADEHHSGTTAPYAISLFEKIAMFKPIAPLTGADEEWTQIGDDMFQNKRCSHVFKSAERGGAYDLNGKIFIETDAEGREIAFTSKESHVPVTFPYTPKSEYVHVGRRERRDDV